MQRSEVNRLQREALALFAEHRFSLPPFATWSEAEWRENPEAAGYCLKHQMGWDITDFGSENFPQRGLVIFCVRNGVQGVAGERPYAEKLLVVRENQETPFHLHRIKMEDIIVRGGGNLVLELHNFSDRALADTPVTVMVDGTRRVLAAGEPLTLRPGESVTLTRNLWHRFYGEAGKGTVFVGEVSQVNDDLTDNYFFEKVGRFAGIEEDEAKLFPLWNELSTLTHPASS
jgi:D-lyxose ketol-isomerase